MLWRLDTGIGAVGVPKPLSTFDRCAERKTSTSWCLASCACAGTLPDVIFEVLRSKPSLVSSEDKESEEAAKDTGAPTKRKQVDE
jgi:hypothetical protein